MGRVADLDGEREIAGQTLFRTLVDVTASDPDLPSFSARSGTDLARRRPNADDGHVSDEVVLLIFDPSLLAELGAVRDPHRHGLLPIPDGDPGYDVEAALLMAMQAPRTDSFELASARYHRVCIVAEGKDRRRLLDLVAEALSPMVEAARVFECDPPYAPERERQLAITDVAPPHSKRSGVAASEPPAPS